MKPALEPRVAAAALVGLLALSTESLGGAAPPSDGRASDGRASDGRASDGRASDGRASAAPVASSTGGAPTSELDGPIERVGFATLEGEGGSACARALRRAADALGWRRPVAGLGAAPKSGAFGLLEDWIRSRAGSAGADLLVLGTLRDRKLVLEVYSEVGGLVGLGAVRTSGRCGLTPAGTAELDAILRRAAARRRGVSPFAARPQPPRRSPRGATEASTARRTEDPKARPEPEQRASAPVAVAARDTATAPRSAVSTEGPAIERDAASASSGAARDDAQAAGAPWLTPRPGFRVRIELGLGLATRDLSFGGVEDPALLGLRSPGGAELSLALRARPFTGWPAIAGLELAAGHAETVGVVARGPGGEGAAYSQRSAYAGLGWSLPVALGASATIELVPRLSLWRWSAAAERGAARGLPATRVVAAEAGADIAARVLGAVELVVGASYLPILDAGPLAGPKGAPGAGGSGLALRAAGEIVIENVGLGLRLDARGYGLRGDPGGAALSVEDRVVRLGAFVSFRN